MKVEALTAEAEARLRASGVPEAGANAEFLLASVLGIKRGELRLRADEVPDPSLRNKFLELIDQRAQRNPLSYVLGTQIFMGLELVVTPDVLIPRPETEMIVEMVLRETRKESASRPLRILDIGTGSGCIAVALASHLPNARVIGADISPAALDIAARNAGRLGLGGRVSFVFADFFKEMPFESSWADAIVSNPPYIPSERIGKLEEEVLREPRLALDGGKDGLDAVRAVIRNAKKLLKPGGLLAMEIDEGQGASVQASMSGAGFEAPQVRRDLNGFERAALGRLFV